MTHQLESDGVSSARTLLFKLEHDANSECLNEMQKMIQSPSFTSIMKALNLREMYILVEVLLHAISTYLEQQKDSVIEINGDAHQKSFDAVTYANLSERHKSAPLGNTSALDRNMSISHENMSASLENTSSSLENTSASLENTSASPGNTTAPEESTSALDQSTSALRDGLTSSDNAQLKSSAVIHNITEDIDIPVSIDVLLFIRSDFINLAARFIQQDEVTKASLVLLVLAHELELLCDISLLRVCCHWLQNDCQLLTTLIDLLRYVHEKSKLPANVFTSLFKITDSHLTPNADQPGAGLKRDLIRLIGNLCHNNDCFQNMMRELDGISLIFDQSRIDATNPYITQWTVLAIRNICYGNTENQTFLANLTKTGKDNRDDILKEFGLNLRSIKKDA